MKCQKKYGNDSTANGRLNKWQQRGIWKKILFDAIKSAHKQGKLNLQKISGDYSSTIPTKKKGGCIGYDGFKRITGTKIHVAVNCNSLPISIVISQLINMM